MSSDKDPTIPSPGDSVPGWVNDLGRLYFSKADGDQVKTKINGLSIGIDHLKLAVGLLATGATAVKLDFTGIKVDEKGVTVLGRQRVTWPHARDDKAKADASEKLIGKVLGKFDNQVREVETLRTAVRNSTGDNKYLQKRLDKAFAKLQRMQLEIDKAQTTLKNVNSSDEAKKAGHKKYRDDETRELARAEAAVRRLEVALAGGS
ncbi:hypothetical protein ACFY41_28050 [Streptomyces syringium]|uniref:hypothetical protein n=1 Tax=Streptomyces syringium TaxID=76729 RepID=UPI0036BC9A0A